MRGSGRSWIARHGKGGTRRPSSSLRRIESFGNWLEQLIAESTGKEGKGILPVVGEKVASSDAYGNDRLFIVIQLDGDKEAIDAKSLSQLKSAGHPVVGLRVHDIYELGAQFFLWEMAVAVAGHILGINPFDQPNVESAKARARKMVADYKERGNLPRLTPTLTIKDIAVYGDVAGGTPGGMLTNFLTGAPPGSYISIQAYIQQTSATDRSLRGLRGSLMRRFKLATTVGYGPRFLHSTGQFTRETRGHGRSSK